MEIIRKHTTFGFITKKKIYVFQISLKDPWLLPKCDREYSNGNFTLFGWLFIYFGWVNNGEV